MSELPNEADYECQIKHLIYWMEVRGPTPPKHAPIKVRRWKSPSDLSNKWYYSVAQRDTRDMVSSDEPEFDSWAIVQTTSETTEQFIARVMLYLEEKWGIVVTEPEND